MNRSSHRSCSRPRRAAYARTPPSCPPILQNPFGFLLRCDACGYGSKLHVSDRAKQLAYYRCERATCGKYSLAAEYVNASFVLGLAAITFCLHESLDDPDWSVLRPNTERRTATEAALAKLDAQEADALDLLGSGLAVERIKDLVSAIQTKREQLSAELAHLSRDRSSRRAELESLRDRLNRIQAPTATEDYGAFFTFAWGAMSFEQRRGLLRELVESIRLGDDHMVITFKAGLRVPVPTLAGRRKADLTARNSDGRGAASLQFQPIDENRTALCRMCAELVRTARLRRQPAGNAGAIGRVQYRRGPPGGRATTLRSSVNDVREVIIIGGGPAGYTAALYSARANLRPLIIEGFAWGGQLMITSDVENYPGYPEGVLGPEMMRDFRKQAERFGSDFVTDDVTKVDFSERPFRVWVGDDEYRAEAVIVSTGASARQLGLESERTLQGRGVSYCAVCDAAFFGEKRVIVVGGGDSAMEEAVFLAKFASTVTVVHRRDEFRASPIMLDRARSNDKITFVTNAVVEEVVGDGRVTAVRLRDMRTDEITELEADGLFVAVGHDPNTALFLDQLDHDKAGYLVTQPGSTATNVAGVFAVGDVVDHVYRQAITAAGSGCMGALDAERWLAAREGHEGSTLHPETAGV